jgi:hypothetical protein
VGWQEIFAAPLEIGTVPPDKDERAVEVTEDDFLF